MKMYIGTAKDNAIGQKVKSNSVVFYNLELAKEYAQHKAEAVGALFGNVYRIEYNVNDESLFVERRPSHIAEHVAWSM